MTDNHPNDTIRLMLERGSVRNFEDRPIPPKLYVKYWKPVRMRPQAETCNRIQLFNLKIRKSSKKWLICAGGSNL